MTTVSLAQPDFTEEDAVTGVQAAATSLADRAARLREVLDEHP